MEEEQNTQEPVQPTVNQPQTVNSSSDYNPPVTPNNPIIEQPSTPRPIHKILDMKLIIGLILIIIVMVAIGVVFLLPRENSTNTEITKMTVEKDMNGSAQPKDVGIITQAETNNDVAACYEAKIPVNALMCVRNIIKKTRDMDLCEEIPQDTENRESAKEICRFEAAKALGTEEACNKLSDEPGSLIGKDACLAFVYSKENDLKKCNELPDSPVGGSRWQCLYLMAENDKDAHLCENITDESIFNKNNCLFNIAQKTGNLGLCDKINNSINTKNRCIYDMAITTKDISKCKLLPEEPAINNREQCEFMVKMLS